MRTLRLILLFTVAGSALLGASGALAANPRADVEKAIELIDAGQYSLARSYLAPALIAPLLSSGERSRAYYLRGYSYLVQKMPVSARKDFNRALEFNPNNGAALVALGRLHLAGRGVDKDAELAFTLFEESATLGSSQATFHIGFAYLMGEGVEKNLLKAREILMQAAEEGHLFAMTSLAASYREEHVTTPEPAEAERWYLRAHEAGESKALVSLAYMHLYGEFDEKDPVKAVELFQQAADEGVTTAWVSLAYAYLVGDGIEKNIALARSYYQQAADAGEPGSYIGMGHIHEYGLGVEADLDTAKEWYERAAALDIVEAQLRLVALYLKPDTAQSRKRALYWSAQAARSGVAEAYNDYAWLLATSRFDEVRNGTLALDQAEKAVAQQPIAAYLDTLAAAYAELGDFQQAVSTQNQALSALSDGEENIRGELEVRLEYYQRSQPWRE